MKPNSPQQKHKIRFEKQRTAIHSYVQGDQIREGLLEMS